MNSDSVFAADASIEQLPRRKSHGQHGLSRAEDAAIAAGGIGGEDTPLLARERTITGESSSDDDDGPEDVGQWTGAKDFEGLPWYQRPSILWFIPSLLIHSLAFGSVIVPKINLILSILCTNYFAHQVTDQPGMSVPILFGGDVDPKCAQDENVQALVSKFTLAMQLLSGLFAAVSTPRLGSLSDRYGRVKIFLLGGIGGIMYEFLTVLAGTYPESVSVYWILVGSVIDGICGSFTAAMVISNAYAADTTPPSRRAVSFGWMQGCLFTGIAVGPILAAQIIQRTGNVLNVFYVAIVAHATVLVYIGLVVPESLSKKRQLHARERHRLQLHESTQAAENSKYNIYLLDDFFKIMKLFVNLGRDLKILWPTGPKSTFALRKNLVLLAAVDTIQFGVAMGAMTVLVLYAGKMFGWGSADTSYLIAISSICRVVVLFVILPTITRLVRGKPDPTRSGKNTGSDYLDLVLIWVSLVFDILGFTLYGVAASGSGLILAACVTSFAGMGSPTLQASLTKHVPADRSGQILGAIGLMHALARVISPTVFNLIWAKTSGTYPQAVFVTLAATFGFSLLLSFFLRPHVYNEEAFSESTTDDPERN